MNDINVKIAIKNACKEANYVLKDNNKKKLRYVIKRLATNFVWAMGEMDKAQNEVENLRKG
jgi:hypothetical protein